MTGTAWATFPTSSSLCMIFLILAYKYNENWRISNFEPHVPCSMFSMYTKAWGLVFVKFTGGNRALYFFFLLGILFFYLASYFVLRYDRQLTVTTHNSQEEGDIYPILNSYNKIFPEQLNKVSSRNYN